MGIKLTDLQNNAQRGAIQAKLGDQDVTINFTYRPFTPAISRELQDLARIADESEQLFNGTVELLAALLLTTDILDDNAQPVAIMKSNLEGFPAQILGAFYRAILEGANPKKENSATSDAGS